MSRKPQSFFKKKFFLPLTRIFCFCQDEGSGDDTTVLSLPGMSPVASILSEEDLLLDQTAGFLQIKKETNQDKSTKTEGAVVVVEHRIITHLPAQSVNHLFRSTSPVPAHISNFENKSNKLLFLWRLEAFMLWTEGSLKCIQSNGKLHTFTFTDTHVLFDWL